MQGISFAGKSEMEYYYVRYCGVVMVLMSQEGKAILGRRKGNELKSTFRSVILLVMCLFWGMVTIGCGPSVMFFSPTEDQRVKAGEELRVSAVLYDYLVDYNYGIICVDGEDLYPTMTITRVNGERVGEGVLDFG